jgi:predicted ATPase/class 3 adenylate cyclase
MGTADTPSQAGLPEDLLVGRYRIANAVGRGGQGEVYRAVDVLHDRQVAVKVRRLPPGTPVDGVIAEGRTLFSMTPHANLAVVREDHVLGDRYVLVMDWVDGPTLAERLADGPLDYDECIRILSTLANAIDHLHGHEPPVVHGDIKPANVILSARGPVLVDFGVVGTELGAGTPAFSAPEAAHAPPSPASDVYAIAATAHTLLEGCPPSAGRAPELRAIPEIHRDRVLAALRTALAYDPLRRPVSASAFVTMLAEPPLPDGVVTFLFTDIEGSTRRAAERGDSWLDVLRTHNKLIRDVIAVYSGHEVDTAGDSFFVAFRSAADAIAAAVAMQRRLAAHDWAPEAPVRVRMGIHTGEAIVHETTYVGLQVNVAARVEAAAAGGQVLVTQAALTAAGDPASIGIDTLDLGAHRLKDLPSDLQLFQIVADELDRDFPPLRTLDVLRNNVPVPASSFIGRRDALANLHRLLDGDRLVSLVGPGGSGKTRLALKLASERLHRYADGVWFIELDPASDETTVIAAITDVLGLDEIRGRAMQDVLIEHLRMLDVLFVVDNCEHVIDAAAAAVEAILRAGTRVHVLATSREPLAIDGERVWHVPPMSLDEDHPEDSEAVALLRDRMRYVVPDLELDAEELPAAVAIVRRLDGLPLALELAAASAASLPLSEIASQLDDRFVVLTEGRRTALDRQRTLWGAIDWSYGLLDDDARTLFRTLGIFPGDFDTESVAGVCARSPSAELVDDVRSLVRKSLVTVTPSGRFRMLDSIRAFAREQQTDHDDAERIAEVHARWFATGLLREDEHRWWTEDPAGLDAVEDDLKQSLEWLAAYDHITAVDVLTPLFNHWRLSGRWTEGRSVAQRIIDATADVRTDARARVLTRIGEVALRQGDLAEARRSFVECADLFHELHGEEQALAALGDLGTVALLEGDLDGAEELYQRALGAAERGGRKLQAGRAMASLAQVAWMRGVLADAWERGNAALSAAQETGDHVGEAFALDLLGATAHQQGKRATAHELYRRSLDISRQHNDIARVIEVLYDLATLALEDGRSDDAVPLLVEALTLGRDADAVTDLAESLEATARLALTCAETAIACELLGAVERIRTAVGFPRTAKDETTYTSTVAALRASATKDEFDRPWARGSELEHEDAVALALRFLDANAAHGPASPPDG